MYRGTTPVLIVKCDGPDLSACSTLWLTIKQGKRELTKKKSDFSNITANRIYCKLTQDETLSLDVGTVDIQLRGVDKYGSAFATKVNTRPVKGILKEGEIA